jgi:hypothetical protein
MTDPATIIASTRMGWQLLAKIPWLTRLLLRRAFPISKCRRLLAIDMPGNHARFELMRVRPSAALTGLEVSVHNHLPFDVEFEAWRLTMNINSNGVLDVVLNTQHKIPATGSARISLSEISLSDRQTGWVGALGDNCVRIQVGLHWRCSSAFHNWQDQGIYESLVYVNRDRTEAGRS